MTEGLENQLKKGRAAHDVAQTHALHIVDALTSVVESIRQQTKASQRISGKTDALELDIKFIRTALEFFQDKQAGGWKIQNLGTLEQAVGSISTPPKTTTPFPPTPRGRWGTYGSHAADAMDVKEDRALEAEERELRHKRLEHDIPALAAQIIGGRSRV